MRKKIVAGNWKMNTSVEEGIRLAETVSKSIEEHKQSNKEVIIFPPFTHLASIAERINIDKIKLGAQNCHTQLSGAYTGEVSAAMLAPLGVNYCLVGHSERRTYFFEDNVELLSKIKQLLAHNIRPIFCCGEQLEDREAGEHFDLIASQCEMLWKLSKEEFEQLLIAYEPVWAIGTGKTATTQQAQEVHAHIRKLILKNMGANLAENTSILYGGSCKPSNAQELFSATDIDGGLIGGASLKAEDFIAIIQAL